MTFDTTLVYEVNLQDHFKMQLNIRFRQMKMAET